MWPTRPKRQQKRASTHPRLQRTIHIEGSLQQIAPSSLLHPHQVWPEEKGSFQDICLHHQLLFVYRAFLTRPGRALRLPNGEFVLYDITLSKLHSYIPTFLLAQHVFHQYRQPHLQEVHDKFVDVILDSFDFIFSMLDRIILDAFDQHLSYILVIHYTYISLGFTSREHRHLRNIQIGLFLVKSRPSASPRTSCVSSSRLCELPSKSGFQSPAWMVNIKVFNFFDLFNRNIFTIFSFDYIHT